MVRKTNESDVTQEDRYHYPLKEYRNDINIKYVIIVHKFYLGFRYYLKNNKVIKRDPIGAWAPHGYKCIKCGLFRKEYEDVLKHRKTCAKSKRSLL
jgi:hypothetical protein